MLSILIPTYNYNAYPLAKELEKQALFLNLPFELICIDDGSFSPLNEENQKINTLTNCKFIEGQKNIGRAAMRLKLAKMARYNKLLLLDADVKPSSDSFLKMYSDIISKKFDVYFGGFAYSHEDYDPKKSLRYTFGKQREEVSAQVRNQNPYKIIISANFLIDKETYMSIMGENLSKSYGMDYFFGAMLKKKKAKVLHLDNQVLHKGIDTNVEFLNKTEKAVENLYVLNENKQIQEHSISLLKTYNLLNALGLKGMCSLLFRKTSHRIKNNLLSPSPNLVLFDLYKLGYLCSLSKKNSL